MRQRVLRSVCLLGTLWIVLAPAPAQAEPKALYWQTSGQCWQTGQLDAEHFSCENAATPGYLATHTINDNDGYADLALASSGHYCSYSGLGTTVKAEEKPWGFETTEPFASYQEGDGDGDVCAAWSHGEPLEWGLRVQNEEPKCTNYQRCGMQSYWSFGGQGLTDRPWNSYFGKPSLHVYALTEPIAFQPKEGGGWGYLCPVLEEEKVIYLNCVRRSGEWRLTKWKNGNRNT